MRQYCISTLNYPKILNALSLNTTQEKAFSCTHLLTAITNQSPFQIDMFKLLVMEHMRDRQVDHREQQAETRGAWQYGEREQKKVL